jgi:hypothetical protein
VLLSKVFPLLGVIYCKVGFFIAIGWEWTTLPNLSRWAIMRSFDAAQPGTILSDGFIVAFMEERGWEWGGCWQDRVDYQHFEKRL